MPHEDLLLVEQCGSLGTPVTYTKQSSNSQIVRKEMRTSVASSLGQSIAGFFREILLPYGYPDSVSVDYFDYQLWDTLQAFCSTITAIFTTQAILKGVGVGRVEASALSATITWIMKDGTGMIGRIIFTWWKGSGLDCDCKKWRLFADVLNDAAMLLELSIPFVTDFSTEILCASTTMKSVVGVAGGATRASITNHQAVKGNMAEISAKDGSQETLVNLLASFVGIFLLNFFTDTTTEWIVTSLLIVLHLYANYRAVTSLIFKHLNDMRMSLVLKTYLVGNAVLSPERINKMESVLLGFGPKIQDCCGFRIKMGACLKQPLRNYSPEQLLKLIEVYKEHGYLLVPDLKQRIIYVSFAKAESGTDILKAYFHAVLLGISTCIYNNIHLDIYSKRQLHLSTPVTRLCTVMKSFTSPTPEELVNLPPRLLETFFGDLVKLESEMFFTALQINGWNTDTHSMYLNEWRVQLKELTNKML